MLDIFKRKMIALAFTLALGLVMPSQSRGAPSFLEMISSHETRVDSSPYATGGDIILKYPRGSDDFVYAHVFTNVSQSASFVPNLKMPTRLLLVAGGGSGGNSGYSDGGGGGGGGGAVDFRDVWLENNTYTVLVGAGGAGSGGAGNSGKQSTFRGSFAYEEFSGEITAYGGGGGGCSAAQRVVDGRVVDNTGGLPKSGGTGGGHGANWNFGDAVNQYAPIFFPGGTGVVGQGYDGGKMAWSWQGRAASGGGGGAGGPGGDAVIRNPSNLMSTAVDGGAGGVGLLSNILGFDQYFGGGGGGGSATGYSNSGAGGAGGGSAAFGREARGAPGTNGLGGGSGGGIANSIGGGPGSGNGGDGIVVIAYNESDMALSRPKPTVVEYNGAGQNLVSDLKGAFTYEQQTGEDETTGEAVWEPSPNAVRTDAAEYVFRVSLKPGWNWGTDPEDTDPCVVTCRIDKARNPISDLAIEDWSAGHPPSEPTCTVAFGADTLVYDYSQSYVHWPEVPGEAGTPPTKAGAWYVRALVPESANWKESSAIVEFKVVPNETDLFSDHMDIMVRSGGTETLANFPVYVRLNEETCNGFLYSRLSKPKTGEDLRFFFETADGAYESVPHEIDHWNPAGESAMWVLVPTLPPEGAHLRLYWRAKGRILENDPRAVWKDYVGVWHMNLREDGTVLDSTGHGLDAFANGVTLVADTGVFGAAVQAASGSGTFDIPDWEASYPCGSEFSFSGHVRFLATGENFFKKGKEVYNAEPGWYFGFPSQMPAGKTQIRFRGPKAEYFDIDADYDAWQSIWVDAKPGAVNLRVNGFTMPTKAWTIVSNASPFQVLHKRQVVDEVRLTAKSRSAAWFAAEARQENTPEGLCEVGEVRFDGVLQNFFLSKPTISKAMWGEDDDPYEPGVVTPGTAKYGEVLTTWRLTGSLEEHDLASEGLPVGSGIYEIVCRVPAAEGVSGALATVGFRITGSQPQYRLDGDSEDASSHGRILLMNRDINPLAPVDNQGYVDTDPRLSTFWQTLSPDQLNDRTYNLMNGTEFLLWTRGYGRRLWYLKDCRQGNLFPYRNDDTGPSVANYPPNMNYLPYSETSRRISSHNNLPIRRRDVGQLLLRNVEDACVMSPCYEDGIGTVYFDAVNGWLVDVPLKGINDPRQLTPDDCSGYRLVVEVATNCVTIDGRVYDSAPTDDRVDRLEPRWESHVDPVSGEIVSNRLEDAVTYGALANWQPVEMKAILIRGDEVIGDEGDDPMARALVTKELALSVWTNDTVGFVEGEPRTIFYRVRAEVNCHVPARFRIRRVKKYTGDGARTDGEGMIALDNVIASFPPMRTDLANYGLFDPSKGGKDILGSEGAWMMPFPSITDGAIFGRAKPVYSFGPGVTNANPATFVLSAQLNYRWRYLDQAFDPEEDRPWRKVELDIGTFRALEPLDLNGRGLGDIEYYFTLNQETPFYSYVDYSGCEDGDGAPLGVPGFSEELTAVTNHASEVKFQNCGADWFVRLREGSSTLEEALLVTEYEVWDANSGLLDWTVVQTNRMEVVADGTWRGFFRQPTAPDPQLQKLGSTIRYRFVLNNRQTPGAEEWATNTVWWCADTDGEKLPYSGALKEADETQWAKMDCDRGTGYLLFSFEEETRSLTVLHADYQNFNEWSDANKGNRKFVGWSTTGDGMAGTSQSTRSDAQDFSTWKDMSESDAHWTENFNLSVPLLPPWPAFSTFSESILDNGWFAGQGFYVPSWYRFRETQNGKVNDYALQLKSGAGYLEFNNAAYVARGVRDISFSARVGQVLDFNDIAYYDGGAKMRMKNYTFFTAVAYDENRSQDFQGDASVSVIAYYRPGVGCYELRLTPLNKGTVKDNNGTTDLTVPVQNSNILSLYRWRDSGTGKLTSELIAVATNAVSRMPIFGLEVAVAKESGGMYSVQKVPYGYLPMYISVTNTADEVCIKAGVRDCWVSGSQRINNVDYPTSWFLGLQPTNTIDDAAGTYRNFYFRDASDKRLTSGTYGVLSGNCPAVFLKPTMIDRSVPQVTDYAYSCNVTSNTAKTEYYLTETFRYNPQKNVMWEPASGAQVKPPVALVPGARKYDRYAGNVEDPALNPNYVNFEGTRLPCRDALLKDDLWVIENGRNAIFGEAYAPSDPYWGIRALVPTQTVCVLTAPYDRAEWKRISEKTIVGFKDTAFAYSDLTSEGRKLGLFTTDDYRLRFEAGTQNGDGRTDVVVDSVKFTQWRGDEWSDSGLGALIPGWGYDDGYGEAGELRPAGAFTNFTFSSCWIKNQSILMSAKRTAPSTACAIYSPLYDGWNGRGKGQGMFMFKYANAQNNVNLLLQVATNITWDSSWMDLESAEIPQQIRWSELNDPAKVEWVTVTNFSFVGKSQVERNAGVCAAYVGNHGTCGVMRLVMDPALVEEMSDPEYKLSGEFGEIYITEVFCRDEPGIDQGCWWGWNLRAIGVEGSDFLDAEGKMYLPDHTDDLSQLGQSLALNDSVSDDISVADAATYAQHLPFLQTPIFAKGITPGTITFKARKYDTDNPQPAQVTLYGSTTGSEYWYWDRLASFSVTNDTFETYSYTFNPMESHRAYRLVVTGVAGVNDPWVENRAPDGGYARPVRVLLDEVCLAEAIRARVSVKNVGAFRAVAPADLSGDTAVPNVPSEEEQPLCDEHWGVQCEVYAASLPEDIDFESPGREPQVRLHWFEGLVPWGYENWITNSNAGHAWLKPASDNRLVFRSSYATCPDAVLPVSKVPGTTVQYQLEVIYYERGEDENGNPMGPYTNFMGAGEWTRPAWYRPIDYNRDYGKNSAFSAYTILDTVAPHWAWFNEVNIFGEFDHNYDNTDKRQFIEIAVPAEADITGWSIKLLYPKEGRQTTVRTNVLARFGYDLPATKPDLIGMASGMVFRVIARQAALWSGLSLEDGTMDAVWNVDRSAIGDILYKGDEFAPYEPIALVLERASGIHEHEIVIIGTNIFENSNYADDFAREYDPARKAGVLNGVLREAEFRSVGGDDGGPDNTRGVFQNRGETILDWNRTMHLTPGRINEGQQIPSQHPTANTTTFFVYANLDPASEGRIRQRFGSAGEYSPQNLLLVLPKGSRTGTNIVYNVDPWYTLGSLTTNGVATKAAPRPDLGKRTWEISVGAGESNNVTVVASARVNDSLREMGVTEDNPYRDAIIDWIRGGQTMKGPFADPECEEASLAEFWPIYGDDRRPMTLTEMYWLDMDPTIGSNLVFSAGIVKPAVPVKRKSERESSDEVITNIAMSVKLMISNLVDNAAWAPYALRGLTPGETSVGVTGDDNAWTSVTFKVTGLLANGATSDKSPENWIPLRWFVFTPDSDGVSASFRRRGEADEFTADIEVPDPLSPRSPGYWAGWGQWLRDYYLDPSVPLPSVFFSWAIDGRSKPIGVETLKPESPCGE